MRSVRQMRPTLIALTNALLAIGGTFFFCYKAVEYALPKPHVTAVFIFASEKYFIRFFNFIIMNHFYCNENDSKSQILIQIEGILFEYELNAKLSSSLHFFVHYIKRLIIIFFIYFLKINFDIIFADNKINLNFTLQQALVGLIGALIVSIAELYFLIRII